MNIGKLKTAFLVMCCLLIGEINTIQAAISHIAKNNQISIVIDKNSPMQVFDVLKIEAALETDNQHAQNIVNSISTTVETLKCEIEDVKAWAHLGLYFAKKIRTAVALNQNKKTDAIHYITEAQQHWRDLVTVTNEYIQASHLAITEDNFHWKKLPG